MDTQNDEITERVRRIGMQVLASQRDRERAGIEVSKVVELGDAVINVSRIFAVRREHKPDYSPTKPWLLIVQESSHIEDGGLRKYYAEQKERDADFARLVEAMEGAG